MWLLTDIPEQFRSGKAERLMATQTCVSERIGLSHDLVDDGLLGNEVQIQRLL